MQKNLTFGFGPGSGPTLSLQQENWNVLHTLAKTCHPKLTHSRLLTVATVTVMEEHECEIQVVVPSTRHISLPLL